MSYLNLMPRSYSYIYSKLVDGKGDIIGYIAYALYKSEKITFITDFKSKYDKEPTESDLRPFNDSHSDSKYISKLREVAANISKSYLNTNLEELSKKIEKEAEIRCNAKHLSLLKEVLDPYKPIKTWRSYLRGSIQGALGVFLISLLGLFFSLFFSSPSKAVFSIGSDGSVSTKFVDNNKSNTIYKDADSKTLINKDKLQHIK